MAELTPTQRQYVRKRTRVHDLDPSEVAGELNIIPFLDIVVNLIMFMLVTTSYLMSIVQIDSQLPEIGRRGGGVGNRGPELNLNVTITDRGVIVTGSAGKLEQGCERTGTGRVLTVPKLPNGQYNWSNPAAREPRERGLAECLAKVKEQFPDEEQCIVTADPLIEYEQVVHAMDAIHGRPGHELFTKILLSGGVR